MFNQSSFYNKRKLKGRVEGERLASANTVSIVGLDTQHAAPPSMFWYDSPFSLSNLIRPEIEFHFNHSLTDLSVAGLCLFHPFLPEYLAEEEKRAETERPSGHAAPD